MMQRNEAIDRLRGLAIMLVLGLHFFDLLLYIKQAATHDQPYVYRIFNHGYFGVIIFFVLSGYLIASTSISNNGERLSVDRAKFYARRATRIFPLLAMVVLIGVVLLGTRDVSRAETTERAFQYLFAVPGAEFTPGFWASIAGFYFNWFRVLSDGPTHGWFGLQWDVLWSLAVEEQFYLVFPWVVTFCRTKRRLRTFMLGVIATCLIVRLVLTLSGSPTLAAFGNSVLCFDALALGVVVSRLEPWSERASRASLLFGAALMMAAYVLGSSSLWGIPTFLMALATAAIAQGAKNIHLHVSVRADVVLPAFGKLSYGLYLLHPVIFLALASIISALNPGAAFVVALVFAYFVARLSFLFYELPIERKCRDWLYKAISARRMRADVASLKATT